MATIEQNIIIADYYILNSSLNWQQYHFTSCTDAITELNGTDKKFVSLVGTPDLYAIEALSGTSGFLKKTAANTWALDTNTYLTAASILDPTKLDTTKKIPLACIPESIVSKIGYCTAWNASSGTSQTIHTPQNGDLYRCNVAGSYNPDGTTAAEPYTVGDWALYDGQVWGRFESKEGIVSVNGHTESDVTLTYADVNAVTTGNVDQEIRGTKSFIGNVNLGTTGGASPILAFKATSNNGYNNVYESNFRQWPTTDGVNTYTPGLEIKSLGSLIGPSIYSGGNIYLNPTSYTDSEHPANNVAGKVYIGQSPLGTIDPNKVVATIGDINDIHAMQWMGNGHIDAAEIPIGYADGLGKYSHSGLYYLSGRIQGRSGSSYSDTGLEGWNVDIIAHEQQNGNDYEGGHIGLKATNYIRFESANCKPLLYMSDDFNQTTHSWYYVELQFGTYNSTDQQHHLTQDTVITFPEKTGTVAMLDDMPQYYDSATDPSLSHTCKRGDMWFKPINNN